MTARKVASDQEQSMRQRRWTHGQRNTSQEYLVPRETPFVPNVKTFLTLIGRDLSKHAVNIQSWEALFTLTSIQFEELGIDPPRTRRYLLNWRHRFRNGVYGIGGDLKYVKNGTAELRIIEIQNRRYPALPPRRVVVNVPEGKQPSELHPSELVRVKGFKVLNGNTIAGKYCLPLRHDLGGGSKISVTEGMWEFRRGHKVDGGERRKAMIRFLRSVTQRKTSEDDGR